MDLVFVVLLGLAAPAAEPLRDPAQVDVCKQLPGADVAKLFAMELKQTRPVASKGESSRCVYILARPETPQKTTGVVVWLYKPEDYDALGQYTEGKLEDVKGLGDAAILFHDPGDGLFKLRLVVRDRFAIESVAQDADSARKLARLALDRLNR